MPSQATFRVVQKIARWAVLTLFAFLFLAYLNGAVFSAWVSGGPPNPYPLGWSRRALEQLSFSFAALLIGLAFFIGIRQLPNIKKTALALLVIGLCLAVAPYAGRFILQDSCLDRGGSWSNESLQCSNE